ncbi:MAG: DUF3343 domain-containing protein [Planctomycetota bacterium]|jgi:hypothetical protein
MYKIILVQSTSHAIRVEKLLKKAELTAKLIPVPRHLSSDCGVAVRVPADEEERILEVLESRSAPFDKILPLES